MAAFRAEYFAWKAERGREACGAVMPDLVDLS
jgi:hypothetical protein